MILTDDRIFELIEKPLNSDKIAQCIFQENNAKIYIDGNGYKNPITKSLIDNWESDAKKDLEKHFENCPTIPISKLIRDELNRGLKTKNAIVTGKKYENYVVNIWKNSSLDYFINTFLKKAIDTDFNSFIVITKGKRIVEDNKVYEDREGIKIENNKNFIPYVIYISINDVHDFKSGGESLEYFIYKFKKQKDKTIYRVIDSKRDLLVSKENKKFKIISEINHGLDYCPVKQISDIYLYSSNTPELKASQFSHVIGDLISYFTQYKIWKTSEVLHAYPKYWSYGFKCPVCDGKGEIINPDSDPNVSHLYMYNDPSKEIGDSMRCPYCKGEGSIATINSKQVLKLPAKIGDNNFTFSGDPAGFVQFPRESLDYQSEKLADLEHRIIYSATGNKNIVISRLQTATEVDTNTRSLQERINERQRLVESNINFVVNSILKILKINDEFDYTFSKNVSYKDEGILYEEITKAISAKMPQEYINELKKELAKTRFTNKETIDLINKSVENERTENSEIVPGT